MAGTQPVVASRTCSGSRLPTWLWEQVAAAIVIAVVFTVSPQVAHPLQFPTPSVLAELSGPTRVCGHRGMTVP